MGRGMQEICIPFKSKFEKISGTVKVLQGLGTARQIELALESRWKLLLGARIPPIPEEVRT
jgi:hypothetical protein